MAKNLADLRFGIQDSLGMRSCIWRLWVTQSGDVYLANRTMAGIDKYSFHQSGICRSAFTSEHGIPSAMTDRAIFKWRRASTPAVGDEGIAQVAVFSFPTDYLSRPTNQNTDGVTWITAAQAGRSTCVEFAFTSESRNTVETALCMREGHGLLLYSMLPSGEAFFVDAYFIDWGNGDLTMPGNGATADIIYSSCDPLNTGRPIRIRFGSAPSDGGALMIQELGGYISN
jgi:hypothetical protein